MWPAIIAAGASLAGGILGNASKDNQQKREYLRQKEFAQHGIQWKVADAKKAGLHPLYALSGSTPTYSPQSVTGTDYGLSDIGQNIERATEAYATKEDRAYLQATQRQKDSLELKYLDLRNKQLENDIIAQQIVNSKSALANQPGTPPPFPSVRSVPGNGQTGRYTTNLDETVTSTIGNPAVQAAPKPDTFFTRYPDGTLVPYPSQESSDLISESFIDRALWSIRQSGHKPSKEMWAPGAKDYVWNLLTQSWMPIYDSPKPKRDVETKPVTFRNKYHRHRYGY